MMAMPRLRERLRVLVIDEVHHAYGNKHYLELIDFLQPEYIFGCTAQLPSSKRAKTTAILSNSTIHNFSPSKLAEFGDYEPPKSIADIYDAEFNKLEETIYRKLLMMPAVPEISRYSGMLTSILVKFGIGSMCEIFNNCKMRDILESILNISEHCKHKIVSHKARMLENILQSYIFVFYPYRR